MTPIPTPSCHQKAVQASPNAGEKGRHFLITQQQVPTDLNMSATAQLLAQILLRNKSRISLFTFLFFFLILVHSDFVRVNVMSLVTDDEGCISPHEFFFFKKNCSIERLASSSCFASSELHHRNVRSKGKTYPTSALASLANYLVATQLLKPKPGNKRSMTLMETPFPSCK